MYRLTIEEQIKRGIIPADRKFKVGDKESQYERQVLMHFPFMENEKVLTKKLITLIIRTAKQKGMKQGYIEYLISRVMTGRWRWELAPLSVRKEFRRTIYEWKKKDGDHTRSAMPMSLNDLQTAWDAFYRLATWA